MLILTNFLLFIFYLHTEFNSIDEEVFNNPFNLACEDFLITGDWRQFANCKVMIESCYFSELSPPIEDLANQYLERYLNNVSIVSLKL